MQTQTQTLEAAVEELTYHVESLAKAVDHLSSGGEYGGTLVDAINLLVEEMAKARKAQTTK